MKKIVVCLSACVCSLMLLFCMAGCGPDYRPNFVGSWKVIAMSDSAGSDLTSTIEQLISANKQLVLTLSQEDDKDVANFDLAGQTTLTGTWKATSENACEITFDGYAEIPATLSENYLTFEENGQTMTCEKQE